MEKREIFNPLKELMREHESISSSADGAAPMTSTSSVQNMRVGYCPKCKEEMGRAIIANDDTVFYCGSCRVSTPLPDELCLPLV